MIVPDISAPVYGPKVCADFGHIVNRLIEKRTRQRRQLPQGVFCHECPLYRALLALPSYASKAANWRYKARAVSWRLALSTIDRCSAAMACCISVISRTQASNSRDCLGHGEAARS